VNCIGALKICRHFHSAAPLVPISVLTSGSIVVSPYLIFHAIRTDHITILRVLHGSRNIEAEFRR
jgi:plasmid stabilization system protein ParE